MTVTISAFYKFVAIADPAQLQTVAIEVCRQHAIKGTILLAHEGINATVSGPAEGVASLLIWLRSDVRFRDLESKDSAAPQHPFKRMKVKVKPEIVSFGHPEVRPALGVGTYVRAEDWNALIQEPGVVIVDTRNTYEYGIGTFPGAIDPGTQTFREFAAFADTELAARRNQKVAMFCTGGIRCEKATAYLQANGFNQVYHLQGGILKYLEVVPQADSLWQGECYVFDKRVALEHGVIPAGYRHCNSCGVPVRLTVSDSPDPLCVICSTRYEAQQ